MCWKYKSIPRAAFTQEESRFSQASAFLPQAGLQSLLRHNLAVLGRLNATVDAARAFPMHPAREAITGHRTGQTCWLFSSSCTECSCGSGGDVRRGQDLLQRAVQNSLLSF